MRPACSRCGFEIETERAVFSDRHMLRVLATAPARADDPAGSRVVVGGEFWVCARCHTSTEQVLEIVTTGAAEQARLAEPPLPAPAFWPREVLSYDRLRESA